MADRGAERQVLQHIHQEALIELGKSLVRIPSFIGEETPIARWVASYLAARGYEVELQEVEPGWFQTVAILKGTGRGRSLMFNGHLDINPLASGWRRDPFDPWVEGNRLYGAGIRNMKIGSIIGGRGETYDLRSVSRNADLCTAFIAVSTVPGMTAETIRADLEQRLNQLKREDPDFEYTLVHPIERKFKTWIPDHPPMEMPVDQAIVRTLVDSYRKITGQAPKRIGLPASELNARYGDDDAHLWEAGIPAPIYGPAGGSYGEDFAYIDEMVLCSQVLALTAFEIGA
ncbi:MAG: hypothetical protein ACREOH_24160 [Candidatus Entotheonellia bacterium]